MVEIRRLESEETREKKRKRNTLFLSIIMIGILLLSTAGYFSLKDNSSSTGNKNIQQIGDSWVLSYGDQQIRFSSSPEIAKNISVLTSKTLGDYYRKTVYVASDSEPSFYEIYSTLGLYTDRMQEVCYGKCDKNLPEKVCNENETMIIVNTNSTGIGKVYEADNCLFIEGGIAPVDAFLYKIFGVN